MDTDGGAIYLSEGNTAYDSDGILTMNTREVSFELCVPPLEETKIERPPEEDG